MDYIIQPTDEYITFTQFKNGPFDINKIETNLTSVSFLNKPKTAFWGSPLNSEYGWEWWCKSNDFRDLSSGDRVIWTLTPNSKIFRVDLEDVFTRKSKHLLKYCNKEMTDCSSLITYYIDFNKMLSDGYVAVELMNCSIGHIFRNDLERSFYAWDCESIVVLDPSRLIVLSIESTY